jgi:cytochrome oxidase Cu insertion factor (SCO1/SenC/PrrC family)
MFKNIVLTFLTINFCIIANAQTTSAGLKEETNIYNKIYDAPLNIGAEKQLAFHELYARKPLLLALVFTRCSGVCNPFLLRLKENLQFKNKNDSFNVLVLSFDPRDSLGDMELLAERFGLENDNQWIFGVTDSIENLNQSIGFAPVWDSVSKQFDHDALLVGINSEGYITKKLIGIRQGHDMDLLIASVNNVFSPTYRLPNKNMLFSCFNYDPKTGKNKLGLGLLFIALPAVLTVLLLLSVSYFVRR